MSNEIKIKVSGSLGLEVFALYYGHTLISTFLSRQLAWTAAQRLAKKLNLK